MMLITLWCFTKGVVCQSAAATMYYTPAHSPDLQWHPFETLEACHDPPSRRVVREMKCRCDVRPQVRDVLCCAVNTRPWMSPSSGPRAWSMPLSASKAHRVITAKHTSIVGDWAQEVHDRQRFLFVSDVTACKRWFHHRCARAAPLFCVPALVHSHSHT